MALGNWQRAWEAEGETRATCDRAALALRGGRPHFLGFVAIGARLLWVPSRAAEPRLARDLHALGELAP